jgi:hypothetical protein
MGAPFIVLGDPGIEVGLQLVDRPVDFFAERQPVELVEHGAMEALADAVGLRALGLGAGMIDVLDGEVELVFVALAAAELGAAPALQLAAETNNDRQIKFKLIQLIFQVSAETE